MKTTNQPLIWVSREELHSQRKTLEHFARNHPVAYVAFPEWVSQQDAYRLRRSHIYMTLSVHFAQAFEKVNALPQKLLPLYLRHNLEVYKNSINARHLSRNRRRNSALLLWALHCRMRNAGQAPA